MRPTWQQLLARGVAGLIYIMTTLGKTVQEIFAAIRNIYGNPTTQTIRAAYERVLQAIVAGETITNGIATDVLPDNLIPLNPLMVSPITGAPDPEYRYYTIIRFPGQAGEPDAWRTIVVDGSVGMTFEDIMRSSIDAYQRQLDSVNPSPAAGEVADRTPSEVRVTMAFRRG